ncbi:MAG: LysE family translocator [Candidatus Omnitrophica bacterium]|nr:LysE family translocator [Candidatus Omnitrophota bacterium]
MNITGIGLTSFGVALSGAMMPGPLLAVTVERTVRQGFFAGPLIISGHALLEIIMVLLLFFGLGEALKNTWVMTIFAFAGGILLVVMGISLLCQTKKFTLAWPKGDNPGKRSFSSVTAGIIVSLANPYWTLWWLTIGLSYLSLAIPLGISGISSFFLGHILADLAWYSLISFLVSRAVKSFSRNVFRLIFSSCGLFLIVLGLRFVVRGLPYIPN